MILPKTIIAMAVATLKDLQHIPGDPGIPWLGDFIPFLRDATKYYEERRRQYGDVFKVRTPIATSVVLCGPTANKFILVEQAQYATSREAWEQSLSDLFPNGLMLMDGDQHKDHRSIMNEAFKKEPMQGYLDVMPEIIKNKIDTLTKDANILMFPFMKDLTLTLATKVFFGIDLNHEAGKINTAISDIVNAAGKLHINLPFTGYRRGINARAYLVDYFGQLMPERRRNPGQDLFSRLCIAESEEGKRFTDQEIIDHLIFVLMAAHDTTAITLSIMSYFCAKYPEWQDIIRNEVDQIDLEVPITSQVLRDMNQTGLVLKETLRLHPPLITVSRKLEKAYTIDGHNLPPNTLVQIVMQLTQRDERNWSSPLTFDPNRFNKERREELKCPFSYAPFGAGKHHCIGYSFAEMQIKLVVIHLLKRYKLSVPEDYVCPIADVPLKHPKDNLPMTLTPI